MAIGEITANKTNYKDDDLLKSRINPEFVDQFNKNPYTQKLSSFINPYNPKYPIMKK